MNWAYSRSCQSVKELLKKERGLSPALRSGLEVMLLLVSFLLNRVTLNSKNSSKPPSTDPNRKKPSKKGESNRKPGGQKGRSGTTLHLVDDPDEVMELKVDRRTLPRGSQYHEVDHEIRQVIDIDWDRGSEMADHKRFTLATDIQVYFCDPYNP